MKNEDIRNWMEAHKDIYRDRRTGEINLTAMVEGWDNVCADGGQTLDPDHPAWDIAVEVSENDPTYGHSDFI